MAVSPILISLLSSSIQKKGGKTILMILLIIISLIAIALSVIFILPTPFVETKQYNEAVSIIKYRYRKHGVSNYTINTKAIRSIYVLYNKGDADSAEEAADFIESYFMTLPDPDNGRYRARFYTDSQIMSRIKHSPFNYTDFYYDMVYLTMKGRFPNVTFPPANETFPPSGSTEVLPDSFIGRFSKPCDGRYTSTWGYRYHPVTGRYEGHTGIDIQGRWHQPIKAIADGIVESTNTKPDGYGNYIKIKHNIDGVAFYSFYAHMSELHVSAGQRISEGQILGLEGGDPKKDVNPGTSTGHHLHFEIRLRSHRDSNIDPAPYIR